MKVNYGPPGHRGVTQIMGLGAEALPQVDLPVVVSAAKQDPHKVVGGLAAATWVIGALMGNTGIKHAGLGAGAAILLCYQLMKPPAPAEAPPIQVQGLG